ncbi:MarR family transcriptional regulator [Streptomyces mobaraensis]|uniref:MarR family winged helix-turn-helix transcriptional regulator n=2 Tax=Streptomyces TaxID=1883 RepID=UPI00163BA001|nr:MULTISPECIES: MarR family transcriptional regulator [Streptomyces]MBC2874845.1 MarR family transcriptional regulator [Streptomyces sp. TYQ1024]UBI41093.1 MarR family transcriptional regulator [Streptomyces mobaraensis]UKW33581.1 MarR family transcriptional regulator [Streptomyces sp. TYQ1024]
MWHRFLALHAHVEHRLSTALQRHHGLGLSEYRALGFLAAAPRSELRMQELADRLGLNQSSVTRLVGRLNAAGFTYRDVCPDDKRGVYTVLEEAGRARHTAATATYEATLTAALEEAAENDSGAGATVAALRSTLG